MRVSEGAIRRLFRVGLWLKAAHSLVEIFAGLALAFMAHDRITALAWALTQDELLEDPHDLVADALRHAAEGMSADVQGFAAWYLFTHGAIKLALVAGVLANRLWAYPAFIAALCGFILYQVYRMVSLQVTFALIALTVIDIVVLVLSTHDYRLVRRDRQAGG